MKYRIDDFLDTLWQRFDDYEAVASYGFDWLVALGRDTGLDDQAWVVSRCPEFYELESVEDSLRYALDPAAFLTAALPPFLSRGYSGDKLKLVNVDPSLVIGSTYYRNWPEFFNDDQLDEVLDCLNEWAGSRINDCDYVSVGTLPLYIAYEGKNRVRTFMKANRNIRAWTEPADFPEPEVLQLHKMEEPSSVHVGESPIYVVSESSANKYHAIPLPSITIPLLETYGASWGTLLERGPGGINAWRWREDQRKSLRRLVDNFNRP